MNSVVAGSAASSRSCRWLPSMLETNSTCGPPAVYCSSACTAINGPRSEPPMPMLITSLKGLFKLPTMRPERTDSANDNIRSRSSITRRTRTRYLAESPTGSTSRIVAGFGFDPFQKSR